VCRARVDAWDQHAWVWDAALYGLLGLTLTLALLDPATAGRRWLLAGLTALAAAWHLGWERLRIGEERPWLSLAYLTGLFTIWFALDGVHPASYSLLLVLYPQIVRFLRLPLAIPASVALTIEVVWRQVLDSGQPLTQNAGAISGGLVSVIFGSLFAFWITRIIAQSAERRRGLPPPGAGPADGQGQPAEARRLVWDLRPEALSAAPLGEALGRLADRVAEETGLDATATVTGTPRPLSADTEVTLLRVTREALANVTKHAGAGRVAVTLSYMDGEAALDVRDDGAGLAPAADDGHGRGGGLGLRGMRERAGALGGRLAVESAPGRGTTIAVTVPVR
jgi:hypothetical protein